MGASRSRSGVPRSSGTPRRSRSRRRCPTRRRRVGLARRARGARPRRRRREAARPARRARRRAGPSSRSSPSAPPTASSSASAGSRSPTRIATLLLGLYDDDGEIDYVGSAAVAASRHAAIAEQVLPLLDEASDRRFSEPNRWGGSGLEEQPLRPELVAEVRYDKVQGRPLPARHEARCASGPTRIRRSARGASCGRRASRAAYGRDICCSAREDRGPRVASRRSHDRRRALLTRVPAPSAP